MSFSFKRGLPLEADDVFDVRFLKNPFYIPELQPLNGLDAKVAAHVETDAGFAEFFSGLTKLLLPIVPRYLEGNKRTLTIAIGCTGGQHRSVHVAQKLGGFLREQGYNILIKHRDMT